MSWYPGVDVTDFLTVDKTTRRYISSSGKVLSENSNDITDFLSSIEFNTGSYLSEGSKVFSNKSLDVTSFLTVGKTQNVYFGSEIKIFGSGIATIRMHALPGNDGDDATVIIFGDSVDFIGTPRYGYAPLTVDFESLSVGTIDEFYWECGDGNTYFMESPTNVYLQPGVYDVSLSVRIEGHWLTETKLRYIVVWDRDKIVSRTNKCFSLGIEEDYQGIKFSENDGDDWVFPEAGISPVMVWDEDDIAHMIVLDNNDGYFYDMLTRDGPESTSQTKVWKDKVGTDGSGGTDIVPKVRFGEDVGNYEFYWLRVAILRLFIHAIKDAYKGASGFSDEGIPDGLEITMRAYIDGKLAAEKTVSDIPITGDIHFDGMVEGHRIAIEFEANMGIHTITGRYLKHILTDKMIGGCVMSEDDYQEEYATPSMWFSRRPSYIDRATGLELSSDEQDKITLTTGVDGESNSAWSFTEALNLPSRTLAGASIQLWHQGLDKIEIGGVEVTLTDYDTNGSWTLSYATAVTKTGTIVITPSGTGKIFDLRIKDAQTFGSSAIAYYYDNVVNHDGDVVLP